MRVRSKALAVAVLALGAVGLWQLTAVPEEHGPPAPVSEGGSPEQAARRRTEPALELVASKAEGLALRVRGPLGPVAVPVRVYGAQGGARVAEVRTDAEGRRMLPLRPGHYVVVTDGSALALGVDARLVSLRAGVTRELELALRPELTLAGRVVDARTGAPVPLATVRVAQPPRPDDEAPSSQTDPSGAFRVGGLTQGAAALQVEAAGYAPLRAQYDEVAQQGALTLALEAAIPVDGVVVDAQGNPAPGAQVSLYASGALPQSTVTGQGGGFAFEVGQGTYRLVARLGDQMAEPQEPLSLLVGQQARGLVLRLRPGATVRGWVVQRRGGAPVAGAEVSARLAGHEGALAAAVTDAEGRFTLSGLPSGPATLHARADGHAPRVQSVALTTEQEEELTLELASLGKVSVLAHDAANAPLAEVEVQLSGALRAAPGLTGADGRFTFEGVPPGEVRLTAARAGREVTTLVDVKEAQTAQVEVVLDAPAVVEGRLTGDGALEAVRVSAYTFAGDRFLMVKETTASAGRFRLELPADSYLLQTGPIAFIGEGVNVDLKAGELRQLDLATPSNEARAETRGASLVEPGTLGAAYETQSGAPRVSWVVQGSPAAAAGLRVGDLLLRVDGASVRDGVDAYALTRGEPGAVASLLVRREGQDLALSIPRQTGLHWAQP